jgi:hypothetical protein
MQKNHNQVKQCNLFTDVLVSNTASHLALVISNHTRLLSGEKKLAVHKVKGTLLFSWEYKKKGEENRKASFRREIDLYLNHIY